MAAFTIRILVFVSMSAAALGQQGPLPAQLTMAEAVESALSRHPAILAASARIRGAAGAQRQAGMRPNPEFILQTENWRFTGDTGFRPMQELDLYAYLAQPIEAGGKRLMRTELAREDAKIAELEFQGVQWKVRQDVRQAFLRALLAQRELDLLKENGRNFQQIIDYHRARVEQGAMAEADLIKVLLERERLDLAESSAALESERARADLLRAMGLPATAQLQQLADPDAPASTPGGPPLQLPDLIRHARERRVEAQLAQAQIARAQANAGVQKSLAKPDWTVLFGYKRTAGYDTLLGGISVPLRLFNRNEGNIAQSLSEVERAEHLQRAAFAQIEADVRSTLAVMRRRTAMLAQLQRGMLERADESWRISLAAYQEGGADLLRLLDAQRVRNEVRLIFTRTQIEFRLSEAELENSVGEENLVLAEELLRVQP